MSSTPSRAEVARILLAAAEKLEERATKVSARIAYRLELDADEYDALQDLSDRGYDAGLFDAATSVEDDTASGGVTLEFSESDAWKVRDAYDEDPTAYGTNARRELRRKMIDFVDGIT